MTDIERSDLAVLAPVVDQAQSHALFDARRARRRTRRRVGVAATAIACVALVALGAWAVVHDDPVVNVDTGLANQPAPDPATTSDFEVLAMQLAHDPMGTLRAAVDGTGLETLWNEARLDGEPPTVDFDRWVVVSMTIPDDACPPTLTGFERDDGPVLTPQFTEPAGGCIQPLIPKTFVVAIERSTVTPAFTLRLPPAASASYYGGEPRLEVDVPTHAIDQATPEPCLRQDAAEVCLDNPQSAGVVAIRATGLQPGSNLTVTVQNGPVSDYPIDDRTAPGTIITFVGAPPVGTVLFVHVAGVTTAGNAVEGTISTA